MSEFVNTPMEGTGFVKSETKGGPGTYDGDDCADFGSYRRTHSPNGVAEKIYDGSVPKVSGEPDQGFSDDIHK